MMELGADLERPENMQHKCDEADDGTEDEIREILGIAEREQTGHRVAIGKDEIGGDEFHADPWRR